MILYLNKKMQPTTTEKPNKMDLVIKKYMRYFVSKIMNLKNAPFQDELDDILSDDFYKSIVVAFARDHGKSTHLSVAFPLWEVARNHNVRILMVSASAQVSESFMTEIVGNIERNEKYKRWATVIDPTLKGVRPQFKGSRKANEKWSGNSIIIDREDLNLKDPTINAVGLFGSILSKRADVIILDDLVNQINSMTEGQREKVIDWFYTTILPVLVPGGRVMYLGNTWHQDDLVARLMKDPMFDYRKRRSAIISEPVNKQLWEQWATLIMDEMYTVEERRKNAEDFYQENKLAMEEGIQVLWPERYEYKQLYLKRLANPYAFARMYECDPSNRPNQKIRDEWIEAALKKGSRFKLQRTPHEGIIVAISCSGLDLAISEEESSDDTALLTLDKVAYDNGDIKKGDYILRNIIRGKFSPNEVRMMVKDHHQTDQPQGIRVETVGYQEAIKRDLDEMGVPVTGYHTGGEKNDPDVGVNSLAILLELGKLILPYDNKDSSTIKLVSQLCNEMRAYPDGHTGDSLMALWFAYSEMRDRTSNALVIPSDFTDPNKAAPDLNNPEVRRREERKTELAEAQEREYERKNFLNMMGRR